MSKKISIPARAKSDPDTDKWVGQSPTKTKTSGKRKRLTIDLDPALHRKLKLYAVQNEIEIVTLVRTFIEKTVAPE